MKRFAFCIAVVFGILHNGNLQASGVPSVEFPFRLKPSMNIDEVSNILSSGQLIPFLDTKPDIEIPTPYRVGSIFGRFLGENMLILCRFWNDSLFEVSVSDVKDSTLVKMVSDKEALIALNASITIKDGKTWRSEQGEFYADDSSSIYITKYSVIDTTGALIKTYSWDIAFRSREYPRLDSLRGNFDQTKDISQSENRKDKSMVDGFLDVKWGESRESAKTKMLGRDGVSLGPVLRDDCLSFLGGYFGGMKVSLFLLLFQEDEFFCGEVTITEEKENELLRAYDDTKNMISLKYGPPTEDIRQFKEPYYDGDGFELQAIRLGKGEIYSRWAIKGTDGMPVIIICEIRDSQQLTIMYLYAELGVQSLEEKKLRNLKDY